MLTADELLAGNTLVHEVTIPADVRSPAGSGPDGPAVVTIRPLTVRDVQRIAKASKDDQELSVALMVSQALVEPQLTADQASRLPAGVARFLVDRINDVSGISTPRDALAELVQAPLARACMVLAKEFGWTPEEVSGMTIGQILLYLEMAGEQ